MDLATGADLVAVGTGNERYAVAFVKDEQIPYPNFVLGPGEAVRYAHIDHDSTDHAPIDDILDALRARI
jgi:hypothetical protein